MSETLAEDFAVKVMEKKYREENKCSANPTGGTRRAPW